MYQEVNELMYRKTRCETSEEERANAKLECSRANVALRYGWTSYVFHEGIYRINWCGVQSCGTLLTQLQQDTWRLAWTLAAGALMSVGFWLFVYGRVGRLKRYVERRKSERFMGSKLSAVEVTE